MKLHFLRFRKAFIMVLLWQYTAYSQNFNVPVTKATGDLNKDTIEDLVTVMQDTINETRPYRIQVAFGTKNGAFETAVLSDQLIEPQYPNGEYGPVYGNGFNSVEIKKGVLIVSNSLLRGHYDYKFRYQNGNFELIGYTYGSSDGIGKIYSEDFNLSTGVQFIKEESFETGKIFKNEKIKKLIRPLPRLQDINSLENDWQ